MRRLPLSKVYQLLEPGPVVLLTTSRNGRANVIAEVQDAVTGEASPRLAEPARSAADAAHRHVGGARLGAALERFAVGLHRPRFGDGRGNARRVARARVARRR